QLSEVKGTRYCSRREPPSRPSRRSMLPRQLCKPCSKRPSRLAPRLRGCNRLLSRDLLPRQLESSYYHDCLLTCYSAHRNRAWEKDIQRLYSQYGRVAGSKPASCYRNGESFLTSHSH